MERGSWSEISGDADIFKKIALGGICFILLLPLPLALGLLFEDLEAELSGLKAERPPAHFKDVDNPAKSFAMGLVPSMIFVLAFMLFCFPSIVVFMSAGQTYAWFVSKHDLSFFSHAITAAFGLLALALQFMVALIYPIAIAQYARGVSFKESLNPVSGLGEVMNLGASFWNKAAGYWLFLFGSLLLTVHMSNFWADLALRFPLCCLGFASLMVSSRYALSKLARS